MFSTGQLIFAAIFFVGFVAVMIFSYKKDKNLHRKNYKGVFWVAIFFILFILFLFAIKFYLKK